MITSTSRLQPSDVGAGARSASTPIAARPVRVLAAAALLCLALFALLNQSLGSGSRPVASVVRSRVESRDGLLSLPAGARGPVSAALGRDQAVYRLDGLVARNPAQGLVARFGRSGVSITAGSASFDIGLRAFGRGSALRALPAVAPVASASGVSYARGSVREWWANGPLGLEQGFDVARRPAGSGALTLSLAVPVGARLDHGDVSLPGGLRYAGVHATDARGRALPAWLQVRGGRVLIRVDDQRAVYPVRVDPFVQQAELTASGALTEEFLGYSVAVAGDTAVVGAPHQKYPQPEQASIDPYPGAVYVFELRSGHWAQTAKLTAPDGNANGLGWSVGISETGTTIVAGAPGPPSASNPCDTTEGNTDPGQAYVYSMPEGGWSNMTSATATLTASDACPGDGLGWSVGISGSTVVVGAPWGPTVADENEPGYPPVPEQGEVYEYTMPSGGWKSMHQTAELTANNPSGYDVHLGWSVAVSGGTIVAGDPEQGVGSHGDAGAAYVFVKPAGEWTSTHQTAELTASDPDPGNDELAYSVAVSGNTIVAGAPLHKVGANKQGAAYVFVMPAGGWTDKTQNAELTASDGQEPDEFGGSVAVSGTTVVVGARQHLVSEYADQGAAYVFSEPSGGWSGSQTQAQELTASDGKTDDGLGDSIAISGNMIIAGAPRHVVAGEEPHEKGAAYVFEGLIPTIKKLSPKKGTTAGGTRVTIKGTNFTGVTAVKFGSTDATIDSSSSTSITVTTPAEAAGTAAVSVTTDSGTSSPSSKAKFKFKGPKK
jgi:IPT/TIG domain/FG-GAP repeat